MRYVTQHLHRGIQQAFSPTRKTADQSQRQANRSTDGESDQRAPGTDGQMLPKLAAGGKRPEGFDNTLRRG
ncbi:hypothetical protein SDC9_189269 [bioreactor metagenome]|uniref:Uncharacterized protein n=1 Tax=bioreactor metagenome TaxID=1076179 RepID=A0A645HZY3_9ZZZZ